MQKKLNAEMINGWRYFSNLQQLGITIGTETVDNIISAMPNKASARIIINGNEGSNIAAFPTPYGQLHIEKYVPTRVQLTYVSSGTTSLSGFALWYGLYYNNFVGWKKSIIEDLPQEFNLPLMDGITAEKPCKYWRNQFGEITIYGELYWASGLSKDNIVVATLPIGFRPTTTVTAPATFWFSSNGRLPGSLYIHADGSFYARIWGPSIPTGAAASMYISASFLAAP